MRRTISVGMAAAAIVGVGFSESGAAGSPALLIRSGTWMTGAEQSGHYVERAPDAGDPNAGGAEDGGQGKLLFDLNSSGEQHGSYVAGEISFGPIGIHGFHGTSRVPSLEQTMTFTAVDDLGDASRSRSTAVDRRPMEIRTYHVLAGYDVGPVSVGGGWMSLSEVQTRHGMTTEWDDRTSASGPAIGGFGSVALAGRLSASGHVLYAPSADTTATFTGTGPDGFTRTYSEEVGTGQAAAGEVRLVYSVSENVALEAGYSAVGVKTDFGSENTTNPATGADHEKTSESSLVVSGYFAGATLNF